MSYRTNSWVFESVNGDCMTFKKIDGQDQFEVFYDSEDEREHGILFEKKDISDLVNLLLEIQSA